MTGQGRQRKDGNQTVGSLFKSSELEIPVAIGRHMNTIVSVAQLALVVIMLWGLCKGLLPQGARAEDEPFRDAVFWFGMLLVISHIVELTRMPYFYWVMRDCDKMEEETQKGMENFKDFITFQALGTMLFIFFFIGDLGAPIWFRAPFLVILIVRYLFLGVLSMYVSAVKEERLGLVLVK